MVDVENKIQRYDTYKYSGVEWLGDIPEHWKVVKLKYLIESRTGYAFPSDRFTLPDTDGIPVIRISDLDRDGEVKIYNCPKLPNEYLNFVGKYGLRKNDILFAMTGGTIGKVAVYCSNENSLLNQRVCSFTIENDQLRKIIFYWMKSTYWKDYIDLNSSGGAQPNISDVVVLNLSISLPPLPEQTAIAQFLDDKTTKIDQAIAIKQQQIALLKERKQILIHKAVTRGLDDGVTLKDSGVEWIGEIPEHWEVKRLKFLMDEVNIRSTTGEEELLSLSKYKGVIPKSLLEERAGQAKSLIGYKKVFRNCLVINKMQAINGLIDVSKLEGITSPDYSVYRTKNSKILDVNYLNSLINQIEYLAEFKKRVTGVMEGFIRLYTDDFYDIKIHLPPLSEQKEISDYIETASQKIDTAIVLKQREIENLKEYKGSLINGVVTGKVRVC